jgi:hypothetical protein
VKPFIVAPGLGENIPKENNTAATTITIINAQP